MSHQTEWEREFEKNKPKTDNKLLNSSDESKQYYFGYRYIINNEIFEVTDWGNIKTFIATLIAEEYERGVKFAEGMAIHEGEEKERERTVKILEGVNPSVGIQAAMNISREAVEYVNGFNQCKREALLAINVQDNGKSN